MSGITLIPRCVTAIFQRGTPILTFINKGRPIPNMLKWDVLVTTYEMVLADSTLLKNINWRYTVIDEAHRLKNKALEPPPCIALKNLLITSVPFFFSSCEQNSKLLIELQTYKFSDILLLTGTPLQNSTEELWSLLNFLDPIKFGYRPPFPRAKL